MNQGGRTKRRNTASGETGDQLKVTRRRWEVIAWLRTLGMIGLLCALSSCSKPPPVQNATSDPQSAATYISQADQFYSQREDLTRLQQGIVLLRQALTADPGNYDAAW